jgi:hypothetical protein
MKKTLTQLTPIPVEFVVGHAQAKHTENQRKPYVELIQSWAEHEGMDDEGLQAVRRIAGEQLIDAQHMPKEFYQQYRQGEKAEQLIAIIQDINEKIVNNEENWTWALVMRVMIDENILLANISVNRFDAIICSMIPGKGRDTVRKNGDYDIMRDRDDTYHTWSGQSHLNPKKATNRDLCHQIALRFAPILSRKITSII